MSAIPDNIDPETGVILAAYETPSHLSIKLLVGAQMEYVNETFRDPDDPDKFARLSGDTLSMVLMELTATYESLSKWLADEKLHLADLKTALELKFADEYLRARKLHDTNETSRMKAKLACADDYKELDIYRHGYDVIESWKKSIGRYHDAVRSQLSYEKQMAGMGRGQG